jgi:hypothetical protein
VSELEANALALLRAQIEHELAKTDCTKAEKDFAVAEASRASAEAIAARRPWTHPTVWIAIVGALTVGLSALGTWRLTQVQVLILKADLELKGRKLGAADSKIEVLKEQVTTLSPVPQRERT